MLSEGRPIERGGARMRLRGAQARRGISKDLSRLAAGRRQHARQLGVDSIACRTQTHRDYTTPAACQSNAWIYMLASGRVCSLNWSKCFYPTDPLLSLPSVDIVSAYMLSSALCGFPKAVNKTFKIQYFISCIQKTDFNALIVCWNGMGLKVLVHKWVFCIRTTAEVTCGLKRQFADSARVTVCQVVRIVI